MRFPQPSPLRGLHECFKRPLRCVSRPGPVIYNGSHNYIAAHNLRRNDALNPPLSFLLRKCRPTTQNPVLYSQSFVVMFQVADRGKLFKAESHAVPNHPLRSRGGFSQRPLVTSYVSPRLGPQNSKGKFFIPK